MSVTKVTDAMRNVTQVDAAKITTGTIPDARIQASGVTQHVTATDLTPIRQDIAMLALYNAVCDNRAAYNLPFSFVDQFEDDTGLTTQTNVDRDTSGEYVSSIAGSGVYTDHSTTTGAAESGTIANLFDNNNATYLGSGGGPSQYFYTDLGSGNEKAITRYTMTSYTGGSGASPVSWTIEHSSPPSGWNVVDTQTGASTWGSNEKRTFDFTNTTAARYWQITMTATNSSNAPELAEMEYMTEGVTASATGTLISDTQTVPSAITKMSGVILYKDNAGTATLGTDLVISLSANGGSNYTEAASYGAVTPLFSTGVKMVRLGETTVTSGTAPVIKAVWANQAASSKETQLHGWAMNY